MAKSDPKPRSLWGKYRAIVIDSLDPLLSGRLKVTVAGLPDTLLNWCMPCLPYEALQSGSGAIPPVGTSVWVEFEGGDPSYPIWTGCFWPSGAAEIPPPRPE